MALKSTIFKAVLIVVAFCSIISCGSEQEDAPAADKSSIGTVWTGTDLVTGEQVTFPAVLKHKPAVLLFWATWCPYCKAFMPYAREIQADYADRGVQLVTFNAKERGEGDPKAYVEGLGFPMIAIADADDIAELYGVKFIPGLMVVDGTGKITYQRGWTDLPAGRTVAGQWSDQVRGALDKLVMSQ
jgi:thiol-disulfide isomerase/thioredoxin